VSGLTHPVLSSLNAGDFGYRILFLGHLLFVIVGFGSTFVWPVVGREADKRPGPGGVALSEVAMKYSRYLTTYAIYAAGAFGFVLAAAAGLLDQMWAQAAIVIYLAAVLFSGFVHVPNLEKMDDLAHQLAAGPPPGAGAGGPAPQVAEMGTRAKAAARNGGILHLAFVVLLILMIWKPS
jgi:hypothetical protein